MLKKPTKQQKLVAANLIDADYKSPELVEVLKHLRHDDVDKLIQIALKLKKKLDRGVWAAPGSRQHFPIDLMQRRSRARKSSGP